MLNEEEKNAIHLCEWIWFEFCSYSQKILLEKKGKPTAVKIEDKRHERAKDKI